jgi:hypothetical protein
MLICSSSVILQLAGFKLAMTSSSARVPVLCNCLIVSSLDRSRGELDEEMERQRDKERQAQRQVDIEIEDRSAVPIPVHDVVMATGTVDGGKEEKRGPVLEQPQVGW